MLDWNPALWQDLPQEEKDLIRQMAPFCAVGNPVAMEAMETYYRAGSELQPARLYYGASLGDDLACLILGRYHLHGWFLFPRDSAKAQAFQGCKNLRTIHIPRSVWRIEEGAFQDCTNLENIVLPKGLTHLGAYAFAGCKGLKTMDLPGCVGTLEEGTFQDSGLTEAVLRSGVRWVGAYAFAGAPLRDVTLPESVDFIGANAFARCTDLTRVLWKGARHLVARYTLKRGNDPFRQAVHFHYDFAHNQILSHHRDPEPIRTSPHLPPRDVNRESYPVSDSGPWDGFIGVT